jgi:hypothetical protein
MTHDRIQQSQRHGANLTGEPPNKRYCVILKPQKSVEMGLQYSIFGDTPVYQIRLCRFAITVIF